MSDNSQFILTGPDTGLPNSRTLDTALGLILEDTGAGGSITITPSGNLQTLANFTTQTDFISYETIDKIIPGSIADGTGIQTVRSTPGVVTVNVVPNTTHQLTAVEVDAVETVPGRSILNFTATGTASVSVTDANGKANVNIDASAGANPAAKYVLNATGDGSPQLLSALTTGLMKVTTTTGIVSTAVAGTDYQAPSAILTSIAALTPATGTLLVGNGTAYDDVIPGTAGTIWTSEGPGVQPSWQVPPGGGTGVVVTGTSQTLSDNITYIANNNSSLITFTLPTLVNANPGKYYQIVGLGTAGWTLAQNATQKIQVGDISTATGTGGSISSILPTDSITIWCVTSTQFVALLPSGQVSVVE